MKLIKYPQTAKRTKNTRNFNEEIIKNLSKSYITEALLNSLRKV